LPATSINNIIGKRFIELLNVDSTNNYAMQQLQKGEAQHGNAYFAFEQTAGKGRFKRQWLSARGENIILSVVLDTAALRLSQQFSLNMIAALSVLELFNKYTTEKNKIKWPNDIYCRDRKAAGILIENVIRGQKWQYAVAGFGVNINQTAFHPDLKNPVSLKQLTGKSHDVVQLAKELCAVLERNLMHLRPGNDDFILKAYNNQLYKRNETAQFKQASRVFSGLVKNVDEFGRLVVESDTKLLLESGSVEWVH
jgi:BirA family biotin operon repressor/biotin-[acetyl-CoA-carboxylase] ligase